MGLHLADVFRAVADDPMFQRLPPVVGRVFRDVMRCRTEALGGHWSECEDGHRVAKHYNACRSRSCPRCGYYRCAKWLRRQSDRLLGCPHHHLIFTIPHELNQLWRHNYAVLGKLLFSSVRRAIFTLAADPRYIGGMPGVVLALHTWGQQLFIHPHIHAIVTAGGALLGGVWMVARRRSLFPVKPLQILFKETFLSGLLRLAKSGQLRLPPGWGVAEVKQLCRDLRHKRWNIEICERYSDPTAVLNYLGRYINGGPIGESRLLRMEGETVWFRYKDNRSEGPEGVPTREMALSTREFVRRVLQHVPPAGFHTVRGYGLYRRGGGPSEQLRREAQAAVPLDEKVRESLVSMLLRLSTPPAEEPAPTHCPTCGKRVWLRFRPRPGEARVAA